MAVIGGFSDLRFLTPFHFCHIMTVIAFTGFMHAETSFFHNLWPFKEVVLKGGFFLRVRLWPFIEVDTL